jgi:hypothetical protein
MHTPTHSCSADLIEAGETRRGVAVMFCVAHLIVGVVAAFAAIVALALFASG